VKILYSSPQNSIARVYVAELSDGAKIEFVESTQPPLSINEKWVLIISTLKGCPVDCAICDAGGNYKGKLNCSEMLEQIKYMVVDKFTNNIPITKKLKIQFARMGEPALNDDVLEVLRTLPAIYDNKILFPSISTIAPTATDKFFNELIDIKDRYYPNGRFQMQFSIHTTDEKSRRELIPISTWGFNKIAAYGDLFYKNGDRKITLNFATPLGYALEAETIREFFSPEKYLIKYTPVNPTKKAINKSLKTLVDSTCMDTINKIDASFKKFGYQTIISVGELEENKIGSNCGMYIGS
jgi:23S rRNA (adenine2503-C2)-methyltransferase